jgi:hypothetical protein
MKKHFIYTLPGFIFLVVLSSCFHNHNISITVSDDEDEYEMDALYRKNQTHKVRAYLNEHLLNKSVVSFKNKSMDEEITLDDNTTFYINSYPGELRIKIDKTENSAESFEKVKQVCEDLKDILADN